MLAIQILFFVCRVIFYYDDSFDGKLVANCLFIMIWQSLTFLVIHLLVTEIGFMYSKI